MLSARLVRLIEDHAEDLTRSVLADLASNPRTPAYHRIPRDELHHRVHDVYRNLGRWLGDKTDEAVEPSYLSLGRRRLAEGVPLSEVVYALILTKHHLASFIRSAGLVDSAVELYQEEELNLLVDHFFDKAVYHTVRGYEQAAAGSPVPVASARR
jgi:hypothetical protein